MSIYQQLAEAERKGIDVAVCTIVYTEGSTPRHAGTKMLVFPDGKTSGTVGGGVNESKVIQEAQSSLQDRTPRFLHLDQNGSSVKNQDGKLDIYIEPLIIKATLVVVGGGHVGRQVVFLGKWLGYRVILNDDRPGFCNPDAVPGADEYHVCKISELVKNIPITPTTFLVLTTKESEIDVEGIPFLLNSDAGYIGVIGSKQRWNYTKKLLLEKGINEELISRIHSPIGLDIQAETPEEIALSILAELILTLNK